VFGDYNAEFFKKGFDIKLENNHVFGKNCI
jgi:hypothetical protein